MLVVLKNISHIVFLFPENHHIKKAKQNKTQNKQVTNKTVD